jgi:hypothetical protein
VKDALVDEYASDHDQLMDVEDTVGDVSATAAAPESVDEV